MNIRTTTQHDIESLCAQDQHNISRSLLERKISANEILLAEEDGTQAGLLRFGLFWDSIPFMNQLWVEPNQRGVGIGRQLVGCWEERMRTLGFPSVPISLETLSSNSLMSKAKEVFYVSRLVINIKGSDSAPTRSPRTGEHLNAKMPGPNALSSTAAGKTSPTLNWPKTIYAMTQARRTSALPGGFFS